MSKVKQGLLRPMDIAYQAFQAGISFADMSRFGGKSYDIQEQFKLWWAAHPQTKEDGGLK